jgi:hypothetical protein
LVVERFYRIPCQFMIMHSGHHYVSLLGLQYVIDNSQCMISQWSLDQMVHILPLK